MRSGPTGVEKALKELNDKGGVPNTVGEGLLNALST